MKLELELGTNELGNNVIDQFFVWKLKEVLHNTKHDSANWHPDDKKYNKKLAKACRLLLEYYGESEWRPVP